MPFTFTKEQERRVRDLSAAEKKDSRFSEWKSIEVRVSSFGQNRKCARVTLKNGTGFFIGFDCQDPHPVGSIIEPRFVKALEHEKAEHGFYLTTLSK